MHLVFVVRCAQAPSSLFLPSRTKPKLTSCINYHDNRPADRCSGLTLQKHAVQHLVPDLVRLCNCNHRTPWYRSHCPPHQSNPPKGTGRTFHGENLRENPSLLSGLHLSRGVVPAPLSVPTPPYPRDGLQTRADGAVPGLLGRFG
jgi:hypothetical protein